MKTIMPKKEMVRFDPFDNEHLMDFYRVRFLGQPSVNNYVISYPFTDFIQEAHHNLALKALIEARIYKRLPIEFKVLENFEKR